MSRRKELISWALYDTGVSAYSAIIQTFVFASFFMRQVAENKEIGTTDWGNTIGLAGLVVAILGPILGATADNTGRHKLWIFSFTALAVISTALLWFVVPGQSKLTFGLLMLALGTIGSELAFIFYNGMLPKLSPPQHPGRWSGWAWGAGYIGGVISLLICLYVFIQPVINLFSIPQANAAHIRATFPFTAFWYALFTLPLLVFTKDIARTGITLTTGVKKGIHQLFTTIKEIRKYTNIIRFLIARMIYADGLATLFAFGGVYAAGTFEMTEKEVLLFGISLNVIAGIGAITLAFADDLFGGKKIILLSLFGLLIPGVGILLTTSKTLFWILSLALGIFVGPIQAASRSFLARIAPEEVMTQVFGFYAFSGKATAFIGPLLVAWVTFATDNQRIGMGTIFLFFIVGGLLMSGVKEGKSAG